MGMLLKDLTGEFQDLARTEVELAKVELREEVTRAKDAGLRFGVAAVVGLLASLMLSFALAWGLAEVMPVGVAFLVVGVAYAAIAAWAFVQARDRARKIDPVPEQTIATLKEDVQWARARSN
jgi:uncharacterized membrane protein YqjE